MTERNTFTPAQEKWLTALESGEYRQTTENLCKDGGYCCLGVATHTVNPNHPALAANGWDKLDWTVEHDLEPGDVERYGSDEMTAPPDVVDALHLVDSDGKFRFGATYHQADCLVRLNDSLGMTFPDIVEFIRKRPWLVFTNFDPPGREAA